MAEKKVTQREMYERIAKRCADDTEIVDFCAKKIDALANKSSKVDEKKNTEHRAVMDKIIEILCGAENGMKCTEITKAVNAKYETDYSPNKVNAMLKKLIDSKEVKRVEDKKEVLFFLAD